VYLRCFAACATSECADERQRHKDGGGHSGHAYGQYLVGQCCFAGHDLVVLAVGQNVNAMPIHKSRQVFGTGHRRKPHLHVLPSTTSMYVHATLACEVFLPSHCQACRLGKSAQLCNACCHCRICSPVDRPESVHLMRCAVAAPSDPAAKLFIFRGSSAVAA